MTSHRHTLSSVLMILACSVALSGQTGKQSAPAKQSSLPTLSAQEIFNRVSPSVMVVESLDADGKVTKFGSGVVIAPGIVTTNRHVIEDAASFCVEHSGTKWPSKLIKVDADHDLAELSVDGLNAPALQVRDSSELEVGEKVYAIGSPEGLELTISEGLISGLRDFDKGRVIQTSAAISPGSSGGGLFDAQGRLVGITTFYLKEGQSLNFALPGEWTLALERQPAKSASGAPERGPGFQALVWFEAAYKAQEQGKYNLAIRDYEESLKLIPDPLTWMVKVNLGLVYMKVRQPNEAVAAEEAAIRLKPDCAPAWSILGQGYAVLGNFEKALDAEKESIRLKPDSASAWDGLAIVYDKLGQLAEALHAEKQAIRLNPHPAEPWAHLGAIYISLGQFSNAISADHKALQIEPDNVDAWSGLGGAYAGLGQNDKAVNAVREVVRLKPDDEKAWSSLGAAYGALGQFDKVVTAEREAIRLKPDDETAWFNLGGAYSTLGQWDKAVSAEQEAVRLKPDDSRAWYILGLCFMGEGRRSEVIEVYKKLKSLDSKLAEKFFRDAVAP